MKVDLVMPQMGESIAEGTILKWHKNVGDKVAKDETILEISTDKVDSEIPSPSEGVMAELLVPEGETVTVGTIIARIETDASVEVAAESQQAGNDGAAVAEPEPVESAPVAAGLSCPSGPGQPRRRCERQ